MVKTTKEYQAMVVVTYHITEELANAKIPFIRSNSKLKASDGIGHIYIDEQKKKKPTASLTFSEPGIHTVRITLEDPTIIPAYLLWGAEHIHSVEIPDTVIDIEEFAFRWLKSDKMPTLPSGLKTVGKLAFDGVCKDTIDTLQLPDSVENVGQEAFGGVKHLIVGKSFKGNALELDNYEMVTIPEHNIYLEVQDGFIINRETSFVEGILPGVYNDNEELVLRIPDGSTGFNRDIFRKFQKAAIHIPGSVENCKIWNPGLCRIEFAEGVKNIDVSCLTYGDERHNCDFSIPKTVEQIYLLGIKTDSLAIPSGCTIKSVRKCEIARMELGTDVKIVPERSDEVFAEFCGEVFVQGPVHFDKWGNMQNDSIVHVPDNETGLKIFNSLGFNKQVKVFVGADQPISEQTDSQQNKLFHLLGCPDYDKTLVALDNGELAVTLMYDLSEKTSVVIKAVSQEMLVDDSQRKRFRSKIALPKGKHIIRLLVDKYFHDLDDDDSYSDSKWEFEPACDAMLIDDNLQLNKLSRHIKGVRHLILGSQCEISRFPFNVERVSVVHNNPWLEDVDGCIVDKQYKVLLFVPIGTTSLPSGIQGIAPYSLQNYSQERLTIPSSVKEAYLDKTTGGMQNLKELVFEEGVEDICINGLDFAPDFKIIFPSTLKYIAMNRVTAEHIEVPCGCEIDRFDNSNINELVFVGDVSLRPKRSYYKPFDGFTGNICFRGKVSLYQESVSCEKEPGCFIGEMNDGCIISVADQETGDVIKACKDYSDKIEVNVKFPKET